MKSFPFVISYWNCAAGLSRKWDFVQSYIYEHDPDILFIAEAEIPAGSDISFLRVGEYRLELSNTFKTRSKSRLICLCKPVFDRREDLEGDLNEIIVLKHRSTLICGAYRPFKCYDNESQYTNFVRLLDNFESVAEQGKRMSKIFVGDYNIHVENVNCKMSRDLTDWADTHELCQLVTTPTRVRVVNGSTQSSMIDLVYSNVSTLEITDETTGISDHVILKIKDKLFTRAKSTKTRISYMDWRKYSQAEIRSLFAKNFKGFNNQLRTPDQINDRITSAIIQSLNELVPKRTTVIHGTNAVINPRIQNLKNRKIRAFKKVAKNRSVDNLAELREVSKLLNSEIRKERRRVVGVTLNKSSKEFWATTNKLMGRNIRSNLELLDNGRLITEPNSLAESFSNFFSEKIERLSAQSNYTPEHVAGRVSDEFLTYTREEIGLAIDGLKRSRAQGFDEIPGLVLKDLKDLLLEPLSWLFNSISEYMDVPKPWKISRVVPILKKGNPKIISNYRPVSNVSSLSKVLERCILFKLMHTGPEKLFGEHQHGFTPHRSTNTAALTLQEYVSSQLDVGKTVLMYSADLSAAFDMLRQESLVNNLHRLQVNHNLVNLIHNFLLNRTSFVQVGDANSLVRTVPFGCVQGSVLGPSLFNIYTRELDRLFGREIFKLAYADDSYIAISCDESNYKEKVEELSLTASRHYNWLDQMGMVCNRSKTEFIVFDRYRRFRELRLNINGEIISPSNSIRVLGILFQDNLRWNKQVGAAISSANSMFLSLKYLNSFLSRIQMKRAIMAHFTSRLTFGSVVWNKAITCVERKRINCTLNRAVRLLYKKRMDKNMTNRDLYMETNMRTFSSTCTMIDCNMLYKICTELNIEPLCEGLMARCHLSDRFPNKLFFFDYSSTKFGKSSFLNRSRYIAETLVFDWLNLSMGTFKKTLRSTIPLFIG